MLFLINPRPKGRKRARTMKKPSRKQLAARRKFAAMARARAKAARKAKWRAVQPNPRRKRRVPTMARRRRRRSTAVARRRRRRSVFSLNPRRRHRRYRRNPGFGSGVVGQFTSLVKNAGGVALGVAGSKFVAGLIPISAGTTPNPWFEFAKDGIIAVGFQMLGSRFVGSELAKRVAEGAMYRAIKNLAVAQVPSVATYLGGSDAVMWFPSGGYPQNRISSYSGGNGVGAYAADGSALGAYSGSDGYQ